MLRRSCNTYWVSVWHFGLVCPWPTSLGNISVLERLHFLGPVIVNRWSIKKDLAISCRRMCECWEIVEGKPPVDASSGGKALLSRSFIGKGLKNKVWTTVGVAGGARSQSCMFYLVDSSQRASLLPVMMYGGLKQCARKTKRIESIEVSAGELFFTFLLPVWG